MLLLQMKNSFEFDTSSSTKLVNWVQSVDCCSWNGVTCNDEGYVIGLDLSHESISFGMDSLSSLVSLEYLQSLNLAYNGFMDSVEIAPEFGKLTGLTYLNLSQAVFVGQIPIEISHLTKLVTLDLSLNLYNGNYFRTLDNPNLAMLVQNLTELRELNLDGVMISASGKEWCHALSSSLSNLQVLSLANCYLSGPIDSSILKLQSLSVIDLSGNNLSAPVPEFFANFTNLTSLNLRSCGLHGIFPKKIFQVTTLQTLDLSNNGLLEPSNLPEFPKTSSLQTLLLKETNFLGKIPNSIGNLKKLSHLDLSECTFSGSIPNSFANLTRLIFLELSSNRFTGPISSICWYKNLTEIRMANNVLTGQIPSTCFKGSMSLQVLDLSSNSLSGTIPLSMFANPSLYYINLSSNQFSGEFHEFPILSSSVLRYIHLSNNNLEGPIPMSVFELQSLEQLDLSFNKFNGTFSTFSSFPSQLTVLRMASCNLKVFPNLRNLSRLKEVDLSDNQIHGKIPYWISTVGNGSLDLLNLSSNYLVDLEQPFPNLFFSIKILDLHSNMLQGQIPILAQRVGYWDYSINNLTSHIPIDIGNYLGLTMFFSLSGNKLIGKIPESICKVQIIEVLDLSQNALNGTIPPCLLNDITWRLGVLNLAKNNFHGYIPAQVDPWSFSNECQLRTLDLSGNILGGQVPKSLASCKMLEVLNLGNNKIIDNFPCWLNNLSSLRVLVLRSNRFQGPIKCPNTNLSWSLLQILDLASNNFSGNLPSEYFLSWKTMMVDHDGAQPINYSIGNYLGFGGFLYRDSITVVTKNQQLVLVKILTIFTCIDFSGNMFQGKIPGEMGYFKSLHALNISHNALTGHIPPSMVNLKQLESLDLSQNKLNGMIPMQLVGLTFLSVLNLSFNQLEGMIPSGNQFQTFSEASFQGNKGLCGTPLKVICKNDVNVDSLPPTFEIKHSSKIKWEYISAEIGFVFGFGVVIGPPLFWKRWRKWYCKYVIDRIAFKILGCQGQGKERRARRDQRL